MRRSLTRTRNDRLAALDVGSSKICCFIAALDDADTPRVIDAVADTVWKPLLSAFTPMQRRQDIFMAGTNSVDGAEWVTSMGKFMGLFDEDWLGIPSTGKITFLPYVEFNRISDGKISESAFFCDIISVMKQVGLTPLPIQTGADIINPGPRTHDGLMFNVQDPAESKKSLDLANRMCDDLVKARKPG